jgi:osmotically-inducible protein OsmY
MQKTDAQLQRDVFDALRSDPRLQPGEIEISTTSGEVTLTGIVGSWEQKLGAAEAAHRVPGVLDVANDITVGHCGNAALTDPAVALAIRRALQWALVPAEMITSTVADGFVTLAGEVESYLQRDAAANAVRSLAGVVAVNNRIVVRPRPRASLR